MNSPSDAPDGVPGVTSCWSTIGIQGDSSCPELNAHVHCRNCPVYADGAAALLDRPISTDATVDGARHFSVPKPGVERDALSAVVFRLGTEWFALPTSVVAEVAERRAVHTVPHRRTGAVFGVVNVRGELLVCVSLARALGLETTVTSAEGRQSVAHERLLVVHKGSVRAVLPADEVAGIQRFSTRELRDVPTTVRKAATAHSRAVISWRDQVLGLLDDQQRYRARAPLRRLRPSRRRLPRRPLSMPRRPARLPLSPLRRPRSVFCA